MAEKNLMDELIKNGVRYIHGIPGDQGDLDEQGLLDERNEIIVKLTELTGKNKKELLREIREPIQKWVTKLRGY